jgi:hypothetical protein
MRPALAARRRRDEERMFSEQEQLPAARRLDMWWRATIC